MAGTTRKAPTHRMYEVLVSFSALDKGDRFSADDEGMLIWATGHVESGYLRDVTEEVADAGEVGQG